MNAPDPRATNGTPVEPVTGSGANPPAAGAPPGTAPVADTPADASALGEPGRQGFESAVVRIIAVAGVIGVGTALGAALDAANAAGWLVGFIVAIVTAGLAYVVYSRRV